jgi:acylphosphatase
MLRWHIIVHGHVQGVGFRAFTQQQANRHNINGSVKNNVNGTVEIDAEGEQTDMDSFITKIKKGSPFAKVSDVRIDEFDELKDYKSFTISY